MSEQRYERLHPAELDALVAQAPIAWVPIGTLEYHGPHLPFGVDRFEAHGLLLDAARRAGGVVLPATYIASGCLDMPHTLTFSPGLVEATVRETVQQLARRGFRLVVVLTGHGPLDLLHLIKRVCAEVADATPGLSTYGLCWLELNAALAPGPQDGEPRVIDHAALVETSWMLALQPELVALDRLSDDPAAAHPGAYGRNPRFTADASWGRASVDAAAELLARRAGALLDGGALEPLDDLRRYVAHSWPEPLELTAAGGTRVGLHNPGRASRYVSALDVELDGVTLDPASITLVNDSPGETGIPVRADALAPESGFYVRREQTATIDLGRTVPADARLRVTVGLGGVTTQCVEQGLRTGG
jgi:creatinine amidohydrolase